MEWIAIAPKYNSAGKHDATSVFQPEATRFAQSWASGKPFLFDNRAAESERRNSILNYVGVTPDVIGIAFFCHGLKTSIQAGFNSANIGELIRVIQWAKGGTLATRGFVVYYACTTGAGVGADGGLCDRTRDVLCLSGKTNCLVFGHLNSGHATLNPYGVFVEGEGSPVGCAGGRYIIQPGAKPLWDKWKARLQSDREFRYMFPTFSVREIIGELLNPSPFAPKHP